MNQVIGQSTNIGVLTEDEVRALVAAALDRYDLRGARVLVIIPDNTRTAPIPLFYRLFLLRSKPFIDPTTTFSRRYFSDPHLSIVFRSQILYPSNLQIYHSVIYRRDSDGKPTWIMLIRDTTYENIFPFL